MRLIHTSDIHLDASFAAPGLPAGFGNRRRQALRDVFSDIVRRTQSWPADGLLIAGDLFELERVSRDTVAFLKQAFAALDGIPVFIAPGNHDPYVPTSPYATETWPDNVFIFTTPEWQAVELPERSLTVHGFAFDGPDISRNPFGALQIPRDRHTHIAVGHGSEMGCLPPEKGVHAPFTAADAATDRLRYLALGHYHTLKGLQTPFATSMWYSGAPEGHTFKETGVLCFLEVTVGQEEVDVRPTPSSRFVFEEFSLDCSAFDSSHEVVEALRCYAQADGSNLIARIRLVGACRDSWRHEIAAIRHAVESEFEALDLVDALEPAEDYDQLAREETSLGAFLRRVQEELAASADADQRRMLLRARDVGVAAFRHQNLPIHGMEQE